MLMETASMPTASATVPMVGSRYSAARRRLVLSRYAARYAVTVLVRGSSTPREYEPSKTTGVCS